ncbi:hypothetical protein AYI68_g6817 [Smittium mucronatum]|uniref:DUF952 domain-containing protein n=1 Tax=Smittium mucronatum TaxID=133383 RepID=A0A1R0GQE6_9FUNG|nr:hypothetical protein AYI68_g6817 [Smittium mucronatum]
MAVPIRFVYKIVDSPHIDLLLPEQPLSLLDSTDGFIHLSTYEQLLGTLSRFYKNNDFVSILKVDLSLVSEIVKWESPKSAHENESLQRFPHIYGPLKSKYIVGSFKLDRLSKDWNFSTAPPGFF